MTKRLTPEFFKANRVYFRPKTEAEAAYIQQRLFAAGIGWGEDNVALFQHFKECVREGLTVQGTRIWYGFDPDQDHVRANVEEFPNYKPADAARIRLSKEFIKHARIMFFPKTLGESKFIQRQLFSLGLGWKSIGKKIYDGADAVDNGILVRDGTIYTLAEGTNSFSVLIGDLGMFDGIDMPSSGAIDARVAALEAQLARMTDPFEPRAIEKPVRAAKSVQPENRKP